MKLAFAQKTICIIRRKITLMTLLLGTASCGVWAQTQTAPQVLQNTVFTSTREINDLTVAPDGTLWAATGGGVLRRQPSGEWTKWTRTDGLPSHEIKRIVLGSTVQIQTPLGNAIFSNQKWQPVDVSTRIAPRNIILWRGAQVKATLDGLQIVRGKTARRVALPASAGTHISALLVRDNNLNVALFGDGLWQFDGKTWKKVEIKLPLAAREITALAEDSKRKFLWFETRRAGVWRYDMSTRKWSSFAQTNEPFNHNVQAFAAYAGTLYVSTLEDGLVTYNGKDWSHVSTPQLSSVAPRQMVVFGNKLYLRHGDGQVDSFDGKAFQRDVFRSLPRRKVSAIYSNGKTLFATQWGGWSQWNGNDWTHFLNEKELQGLSLMSLYADDGKVWLGTQSRGVAEYSHLTKTLRWHDERHGLTDDWITCISNVGDEIYAGTFVGGLVRFDGKKWHHEPQLQGENVTALEPDSRGGIYIATRNGTWHRNKKGELEPVMNFV